jgi:flagellar M-ring protein FliF
VHLALPNQNGFFREQQKPTASVVVGLNAGRTLDRAQLAGIIHLVSSSVPEMNATSVSILDDTGKLLSNAPDSANAAGGGADVQQLQITQQIEQQYMRRILDILEPVVGRGNVKAQVTAELDFTQSESTSESHKPESTTIRSQQTSETTNGQAALPSGVPGAAANQPPAASSAPINGPAQTVTSGGGTSNNGTKKESTTNYEVDKTIKMVKGGTTLVKRVSAAVVVNHHSVTDAKGKVTTSALTDVQIEKMTGLVRETIGFSKERGDSVNLMNTPFIEEKTVLVDLPFWKQAEVQDLARSFAWPVGTLFFALLVLIGAIRPSIKMLSEAQKKSATQVRQLDTVSEEALGRAAISGSAAPLALEGPSASDLAIEDARKLTRDNPVAVANIVKSWVNGEAAA